MTYPTLRHLTTFSNATPLVEAASSGRSRQVLTIENAVAWIRKNSPSHIETGPKLFRGVMKRGRRLSLMDPRVSPPRGARNTGDFYRAALDAANPSWPQRAYSLVCSAEKNISSGYGDIMAVIPRQNAKVAAVNRPDIWDRELHDLSWIMSEVVNHVTGEYFDGSMNNGNGYHTTSDQWNDLLLRLHDEWWKKGGGRMRLDPNLFANTPLKKVVAAFEKWFSNENPPALWPTIEPLLKYEKHGFTLHTGTRSITPNSGECWVSDECLLIPIHLISTIGDRLGSQKWDGWW